MPTRVSYPSPALPAPPRFTVDVPDGWIAHGAPSVLAMIRPESPVDGASPNMTINADLVAAGADEVAVLNDVVAAMVRGNPAAEVVRPPQAVGPDEARSAMSAVRITADGAAVIQVLTVLIVDAALPFDLTYAFTIACTWAEDDTEARATLHRTQDSFTLAR